MTLVLSTVLCSDYRVDYTASMCVKSLFTWHNETFNMWTEFVFIIVFLALWIALAHTDSALIHARHQDSVFVHVAIFCGLVLRPLASGLSHMFHCMSERSYVIWWGVDYVSIVVTVLVGSLVYGRFTFYCLPQQELFFYISLSGLCLSTIMAVLFVTSAGVRNGSFFFIRNVCQCVTVRVHYLHETVPP